MTKFTVMFDYSIPQFTDIEVEADNEAQAELLATEVFDKTYPEAIDTVVVKVVEHAQS